MRFLLVDDDPLFLAVAEGVIGSLGNHLTVSVEGGPQGLALLSEDPAAFDVLVLDLNMPELDGLAFLRRAGELGFKGNIIISSGESAAVLRSVHRMGELLHVRVLGAISKPLTPAKLAPLLAAAGQYRQESSQSDRITLPTRLQDLELLPYYQAQHDTRTGTICGVEALIRARASDGCIHGPGKLFAMVGGPSELVATSLSIADKVLADVKRWQRSGVFCRTAINFDSKVIEAAHVAETLVRCTKAWEIDPRWICLELTEASLPADLSRLVEALARLSMAGFRLSLDDYGTGGSNFELVRLCPFGELKIDGGIMRAAERDPVSRGFIQSTVAIASDLSLEVVGEGIETDAQLEIAERCGVGVIQGFLFSRPEAADATHARLSGARLRKIA